MSNSSPNNHEVPSTTEITSATLAVLLWPQTQQHSQAARIDALNPRQINHQHSGVSLTEYRVAQYRTGAAGHNSAMTPENTGISQFLNGYLQHHHLLQSFPEILPSGRHPGSTAPKLVATYITNEEQSD